MTKEVPRTSVLRDEALNISDATLIARLRSVWRYKDLHLCPEAADRIELLATTNEQLVATNEALTAKLATCEKYRDAYDEMGRIGTQAVRDLEAKLAKAVDGLKRVCRQPDYRLPSHQEIARATLEELKGENHE